MIGESKTRYKGVMSSNNYPPDGVIRKNATGDDVASRKVGDNIVEVRGGRYDGVTITDKTGHTYLNHQVVTEDNVTKERSHLIISSALGEGRRGESNDAIGVAMDEAVVRAFKDSNLSPTEARQFASASRLISDSLKNGHFEPGAITQVVNALAKIAPEKGGR